MGVLETQGRYIKPPKKEEKKDDQKKKNKKKMPKEEEQGLRKPEIETRSIGDLEVQTL